MGHSRVLISAQGCPTLLAGMSGKYHFTKLETGEAVPVKDKYSDPCDCVGYLLIFLGDGRVMIGMAPMLQSGVGACVEGQQVIAPGFNDRPPRP